ncbi:MAG: hypothetical protein PVS2B2_27890 [Candidatus Acidiferrum sp.]
MDRGQIEAAEKQLWEIVIREPENIPAIHLMGIIRTRQKRFSEAEALFKRVLTIAPDFVDAYRSLGALYELQGSSEEAKVAYLKVHELDPRDVKTSLALGTIYEAGGDFDHSLEIMNSIPADQRPPAALPVLASDYFGLKQPEKVAALAPMVRQGRVTDPSLIPRFARVLVENGFAEDAETLLQSATSRQQLTPEYLLVLARVQERRGNIPLAERTLARVAQLDPVSFDAFFQSARLASQTKDYKKEASLLDKALRIQPNHLEALRHLVLARMRSGNPAGAVTVARRLYAMRPEDADVIYLLGAALANHAEWHEARAVVEKLVTVRDDATAHVMLGMTLLNDGEIEGASRQIEVALKKNPNEAEAHYYKGVIARQHGDLPGALTEMEIVVSADPQHVLAQVELGTLALQMGNLDRARQALELAVSIRPDVPENHYQLGLAYSRLGFQDKAKVQMAEFQKLRTAADKAKLNARTSSDPPAENKPSTPPR